MGIKFNNLTLHQYNPSDLVRIIFVPDHLSERIKKDQVGFISEIGDEDALFYGFTLEGRTLGSFRVPLACFIPETSKVWVKAKKDLFAKVKKVSLNIGRWEEFYLSEVQKIAKKNKVSVRKVVAIDAELIQLHAKKQVILNG